MGLVLFDPDAKQVHAAQDHQGRWFDLQGSCVRCGACCKRGQGCPDLFWETLDGKGQAVCNIHWKKPWGCAVYPRDPDEELPLSCGYTWVMRNG